MICINNHLSKFFCVKPMKSGGNVPTEFLLSQNSSSQKIFFYFKYFEKYIL